MRPEARGFTLLEAVVALAILAAGAMALFAALNSALRSLDRAEQAARLDTTVESALSLLERVNPMLQPEGSATAGDAEIAWRARPVEPSRDMLTDYFQPGLYEVGLYDLDVSIVRDGRVEHRFVLRRAGYRQVRRSELEG